MSYQLKIVQCIRETARLNESIKFYEVAFQTHFASHALPLPLYQYFLATYRYECHWMDHLSDR